MSWSETWISIPSITLIRADSRLWLTAQLEIDTTFVSSLSQNGTACLRDAIVALERARMRKERRYPELVGDHGGGAQLVFFFYTRKIKE